MCSLFRNFVIATRATRLLPFPDVVVLRFVSWWFFISLTNGDDAGEIVVKTLVGDRRCSFLGGRSTQRRRT